MRVTNHIISQRVLANIQKNTQTVAFLQNVLSTGRQFSRVEDNPIAYVESLNLRQEISENRRYQRNLTLGQTNLDLTESTLATINEQLQRARQLALQGANGGISPASAGAVADEIEQLLKAVIEQANSNFEGRYIFGGDETLKAPFQTYTNSQGMEGIIYRGDFGQRLVEINQGDYLPIGLTGIEAFFTSLNEIRSVIGVTPDTLLAPQLTAADPPLSVAAGTFTVDGVTINFDPAADTLESLRDTINRSVDTAQASIDESGKLVITSLTSNDVTLVNGTSNVLESLGMFHRIEGGGIGASITAATTLASLGITGDAIRIVVGDEEVDIDLAGAATVGDVISAVSASGAPVEAFINSAGTGLTFSATESVDSLEVTSLRKIFGSTALASGTVTLDTTLASLGITVGQIQITNDGSTTTVDLSGATTVTDVLDAINQLNGVNVSINSDGTALDLESLFFSSGLSVADVGPSDLAAILGFNQSRTGDSSADLGITAEGMVDEVESQNIFRSLSELVAVLRSSTATSEDFNEVLDRFDTDLSTVLTNRSIIGARTNRVEASLTRFEAFETYLSELLSNNEDADLAETITELSTQTNTLNASLAAGAQLLQTSLLDFLR